MNTVELLGLIVAALLLQLVAGLGVSYLRWRGLAALSPAAPALAPIANTTWAGWRDFRVSKREFEDAAQSQCSFYLQPLDGQPLPPFLPGQFLTFSLDVGLPASQAASEPRTITRCYSLSDRPDSSFYRVTIKRVPAPPGRHDVAPGLSSSHFHDHVHVGDILRVKAPAGHFHLDPDPGVPVVLIGGGIGITPMVSMLRWCLLEQPQRTVHLYYGLRNSRDHAFKPWLEDVAKAPSALRLHIIYSQPNPFDTQGRDYQHPRARRLQPIPCRQNIVHLIADMVNTTRRVFLQKRLDR